MTSFNSNDSNTFAEDGICIKISDNPAATAIPENSKSVYTIVRLGIVIINNTSSPFPFRLSGSLIPELVGQEGQELRMHTYINRQLGNGIDDDWLLVAPGKKIHISRDIRLSWQNNLLRLEVPYRPDDYFSVSTTTDDYWYFEALQAETYQLRFIYDKPAGEVLCFDPGIRQQIREEALQTGRLMTNFINICLLEPMSINCGAVELNGVRFQTEIQPVIPIPILPWTQSRVRLGIRVTNNTSNRLYFERLDSLQPLPMLLDSSGNVIALDTDIMRLWVKDEPYYIVASGESKFFSLESFLYRRFCQLHFNIYNEAGGFFYFRNLKPGKYQLQLSYTRIARIPLLPTEERASVRAWVGAVTLPFVEFCIG